MDSLLDVSEVADVLGVSTRHVWKMHSSARLPGPVRIGRSVRWRSSDIDQWIAMGCPNRESFEQAATTNPGTGARPGRRIR